jgi:hypothetical protein
MATIDYAFRNRWEAPRRIANADEYHKEAAAVFERVAALSNRTLKPDEIRRVVRRRTWTFIVYNRPKPYEVLLAHQQGAPSAIGTKMDFDEANTELSREELAAVLPRLRGLPVLLEHHDMRQRQTIPDAGYAVGRITDARQDAEGTVYVDLRLFDDERGHEAAYSILSGFTRDVSLQHERAWPRGHVRESRDEMRRNITPIEVSLTGMGRRPETKLVGWHDAPRDEPLQGRSELFDVDAALEANRVRASQTASTSTEAATHRRWTGICISVRSSQTGECCARVRKK